LAISIYFIGLISSPVPQEMLNADTSELSVI